MTLGSDYCITYGYDTYGRFETVNAQIAGTGPQTYIYSYLPDSDLLESLITNHGLTVTRTYEPNRDVLTQVQNQFGTDTISQYDYTNDELAQRSSMTTSGTAFDPSNPPAISPSTATYTTNNLNQI